MKHMFGCVKITKTDQKLLAAVFLAAALCALFLILTGRQGDWVVVHVNGSETARYPLGEDREILLSCGEGENLLCIQNGQARIGDADCPDGLCVRQKPINRTGESIICLPHRLVVSIDGGSSRPEGADGIAG